MLKLLLFAVLYVALGVVGWRAYSVIENTAPAASVAKHSSQTSAPAPAPALPQTETETETPQAKTLSKAVHRWKDQHGNWQYGELPINESEMEKYEKELALLRKLPREALPTQAITPGDKNESLLDKLPTWSDLTNHMKNETSKLEITQRIKESLDDTKNIEKILKQREKNVQDIANEL